MTQRKSQRKTNPKSEKIQLLGSLLFRRTFLDLFVSAQFPEH